MGDVISYHIGPVLAEEVVDLIKYASSTIGFSEGERQDPLLQALLNLAACQIQVLRMCDNFKEVMRESLDFALALLGLLGPMIDRHMVNRDFIEPPDNASFAIKGAHCAQFTCSREGPVIRLGGGGC